MKRNGRNLKMPKVEGMTSDKWSTMTNTQRYEFLNNLESEKKTFYKAKKEARLNKKDETVEEVK